MARDEEKSQGAFNQEDHQVAYIFNPAEDGGARPSKRRRVSKKGAKGSTKRGSLASSSASASPLFVPLLNGAESQAAVDLRRYLYEETWSKAHGRIQGILRESNSVTLDQVSSFMRQSKAECFDKIPAAFVVTGPNIASQDLLFEQLSETLQQSGGGPFVRLKSSEAGSLKGVLKKIIRVATAKPAEDEDEDEEDGAETGKGGRRYLDYDLEALQAFVKTQDCEHIYIAFQDSEGFDSSLLSDLIVLLKSWRPRIPFTLLFGIATSVELLQARLLKTACRYIYGGQFDAVQTEGILETVFKGAVAANDIGLRLGAPLLRWMLDRQRDQVAGIQSFISSLKYAYMCHFYANPLSVLVSSDTEQEKVLQAEHMEAIRSTPSFRNHVEAMINTETPEAVEYAKLLLDDDASLLAKVREAAVERQEWMAERLRSLLMLEAVGAQYGSFCKAYVDSMLEGVSMDEQSNMVDCIRRLGMDGLAKSLRRIVALLRDGEPSLYLEPAASTQELQAALQLQVDKLVSLMAKAAQQGITVRSRYSGQSKVVRTTVIAQRVQLSQDSATLKDEDKQLTEIVDAVTTLLSSRHDTTVPTGQLFSEGWVYDSRAPSRDVFVPRPRAAFERSLSRPQDYLSDSCRVPEQDGGGQATVPATAVLYQLYLETGNLINVADLWMAFRAAMTGGGEATDEGEDDGDGDEEAERRALVQFYRGLAELRALGYVKASKKKTDHVAKVKWL